MDLTIRKATLADRAQIEALIGASARGLSREDYSDAQIEAAITDIFGVDTELIHDESYFVVEHDGLLVGCGGWSKRKTLFGGDRFQGRESGLLDPAHEPAKIRAFFVHPDWARHGIGRLLLQTCEHAAQAHGFQQLELMATLPGVKLYRALGYVGSERVSYPTSNGVHVDFVPMHKTIGGVQAAPEQLDPAV